MKKTLKFLGYTILGLASLLFLALGFVSFYKAEILEAVNLKLKEEINGDIHIGKLGFTIFHDFPNVSLSLRNIYLRGPRAKEHNFLEADVIEINVEGLKLLRKEVSIKSIDIIDGEVFVFKSKSGYSNLDIFKRTKKDTASSSASQISFSKINLRNVAVMFHDSLMRKEFGVRFVKVGNLIAPTDSLIRFHIIGDVKFTGLMFNAEKGSFLKNKNATVDFNLEFRPLTRQLIIKPSKLKLAKSDIQLFGMFQLSEPRSFRLSIQSDEVDYAEGLSILPEGIAVKLTKVDIEKKVKVSTIVGGPLIPGRKAAVDVSFSVSDTEASSGKIKMEHVTLRGTLINHRDTTRINDEKNILIELDTVYGKVSKVDFGAKGSILDLSDPSVKAIAKVDFELTTLNNDTVPEFQFRKGRFGSTILFEGKPQQFLDNEKEKPKGSLQAVAIISDGEVEYVPQRMIFDEVSVQMILADDVLAFKKISLRLNENQMNVTGSVAGVVPFYKTKEEKPIKASLMLTSPKLDVAQIFKPKVTKASQKKSANKKKEILDKINDLYRKLELDMEFQVDQLVNKHFKGDDLSGKIVLSNDELLLKDVKMKIAKGNVDLSARISKKEKKVNPFTLSASVKNAEIKDLFYAFNNFNQTAVGHENLSGRVNITANLKGAIDGNLVLVKSNSRGDVQFKIKNGRLRNFEPLQNMSNFLLRGRDFSDVRFGEINSRFTLKGTEMDIRRMEVQSTALTLYLEGNYSLADKTDLSIQVPLSNLRFRKQNIPPENIGPDRRVGMSVFLRARKGDDGKTVISYDPFKRSIKDNAKKASAKKK